jgi:hypothetical protein
MMSTAGPLSYVLRHADPPLPAAFRRQHPAEVEQEITVQASIVVSW